MIFLFLGSLRAVVIPVIAMPLSLIGTFFVMLALGYSINLLTLLALVLAIGLVVDDAIIVVENVDRHMKEERKLAARRGAARGARARRSDHRHDRGAGGGVRADRLSGRPHRRPVHRIRLHAGRRGHGLRHHRADALADDVRGFFPFEQDSGRLAKVHRPQFRVVPGALPPDAACLARTPGR